MSTPAMDSPVTAPVTAPAADLAAEHASTKPRTGIAAVLAGPASAQWYRRPALWGAVVLVLLVSGVAWYYEERARANAAPSYTTQVVGRGNITLTVTATGTLQPIRSINIGSELSGTVLKVNVDVNDIVKKGQVMVELDTAKLHDQILRSRASLAAANAKVDQTIATVNESKAGLARLEAVAALSGGKVPSKAELDTGRATQARALADTSSARASVNDAQAALSTDEINLSKASIRAPSDGVVLTRTVDPGNAVAASLQAVTLFTLADDLAKLRAQVYVDEADVGSVKVDQKASFMVSAYPSRKYPATITRVAFGSTITDNVVTYLTYLDVDNTDLSLRPGMTATATIIANQRNDVLMVPNSALRYAPSVVAAGAASKSSVVSSLIPRLPNSSTRRGAASGASTAAARQVWVLQGAAEGEPGTAVAVAVVPGISDGRMTEIISGDLKAGMLVITDQKAVGAK
jgi:HlyD family secretion protein